MSEATRYADTVVIGGGAAGAVVAARLAARTDQSVLLLEAGPDYGPYTAGRWPADLVDARKLALSHDWGYTSDASNGKPRHLLERARVLGGCSAHNGCIVMWGHTADYDAWAALGNPGWSTAELVPLFQGVMRDLQTRRYTPPELTPFHAACLTAMSRAGIPVTTDLNYLDEDQGVSTATVSVVEGVRWNTAFAYLDPVRANPRLSIVGRAMVDRVELTNGRATRVWYVGPDGLVSVEAGRVVVCGGTYGSPAVLLRSGMGVGAELKALGIEPRLELPGVGANLHDHPSLYLQYSGTPELIAASEDFERRGNTLLSEQSLAKARSPHCAEAFDLHLFPVGGRHPLTPGAWEWVLPVANMVPQARGRVSLRTADPSVAPVIDTGYLTDAGGADMQVLLAGLALTREVARQSPLAELLGAELPATAQIVDAESVRQNCLHYYHPVGTCKMGSASDPQAVVDAQGKVYGTENVYVADAAVMPIIPRANTYAPAIVVAERIAGWLAG